MAAGLKPRKVCPVGQPCPPTWMAPVGALGQWGDTRAYQFGLLKKNVLIELSRNRPGSPRLEASAPDNTFVILIYLYTTFLALS